MPWKLVSCIIGIPTVGYKSTLLQYPNKSCSTILHRHSSQVWHKHVSPGGWLIKGVIHVATNTSVPLQHRFRGSISVDRNDGFPYATWPIWDDFVVPNLNHADCRQSCIASALVRHFRHLRLAAVERLSKGPSERGGFFKLRRIPEIHHEIPSNLLIVTWALCVNAASQMHPELISHKLHRWITRSLAK